MKVPFYDLKKENDLIKKELIYSFKAGLETSSYILGENLTKFEKEWANFIKARYSVGVGNGTDALIISLKALGVGPGDEVIVPAFTFVATAFAVSIVGATPVFVDIDMKTHSIDISKIEKAITKRTKALIPVHLYGNVCDMEEIDRIAKKHKLYIIEDSAQAHGSLYKGKKAGALGDLATFSFYPAKNLGALGDGGAIVTNNKKMYDKIMSLRNYGQTKKYYSEEIGFNSRLDELQAAFLRVKLKSLELNNRKRRKIVDFYKDGLSGLSIEIPQETKDSKSCYHLFTIQVKNRDLVIKKLKAMGISALIHYPIPLHLQKAYRSLGHKKGEFPVSEIVASSTLSLPLFPSISTKQREYIVESLKKVL